MASAGPSRARRSPRPASVHVSLPITLGQFVKVAGLVSSGGEAKQAVAAGAVRVNGEVDTRRGRKLTPGDVVEWNGRSIRVAASGGPVPGAGGEPAEGPAGPEPPVISRG